MELVFGDETTDQGAGLAGRLVAESKRLAEQSTTPSKSGRLQKWKRGRGSFFMVDQGLINAGARQFHHRAPASGSLPPGEAAGFTRIVVRRLALLEKADADDNGLTDAGGDISTPD